MANLHTVTVSSPFAGLDTVSGPGSSDSNAPVYKNFLTHYPDKAVMRGPLWGCEVFPEPINARTVLTTEPHVLRVLLSLSEGTDSMSEGTYSASGGTGSPYFVMGAINLNGTMYYSFGEQQEGSEGTIVPWAAPYRLATSKSELAGIEQKILKVLTGGTAESIEVESAYVPFMGSETFSEMAFYLTGAGNGGDLINGGYRPSNVLCAIGNLGVWTEGNAAPVGSVFIKKHLERLWMLGGSDPTFTQEQTIGTVYGNGTRYVWMSNPTYYYELTKGDEFTEPASLSGYKIAGKGGATVVGTTIFYYIETEGSVASGTYESAKIKHQRAYGQMQPNAIWYSDAGGPFGSEAWTTTSPTSGLTVANKIVVGNDGDNEYLVAAAIVNRNLVIFKRNEIWYLTGYSPETFELRKLSGNRGCIDPWSVCEANGGVYFLSQNGFEFFDGAEFHIIDTPVANTVRALCVRQCSAAGTGRSRVQIKYFGNNYLAINLATAANTGTCDTEYTGTWLYNIKNGTWSEITSDALSKNGHGRITFIDNVAGVPWIFDGNMMTPAPYIVEPESTEIVYDAKLDETETKKMIPAKFETSRIDLSNNGGYTHQLHRFMIDYMGKGKNADEKVVWKILLKTDDGTIINAAETAYELYGEGLEDTYTEGRRFEVDEFNEAVSGVTMSVEANTDTETGPTEGVKGEIYGTLFEVQTARQRRRV